MARLSLILGIVLIVFAFAILLSGSLTARLKQLEAARSRGLITDDEYRQAILDSIGG